MFCLLNKIDDLSVKFLWAFLPSVPLLLATYDIVSTKQENLSIKTRGYSFLYIFDKYHYK